MDNPALHIKDENGDALATKNEIETKMPQRTNGYVVPEEQKVSLDQKEPSYRSNLQYAIEDVPPWYTCILLGFQHYLTMFGATVVIPIVLAPYLCIGDDIVAVSELIITIFFVSGLATLLQTTFGCRLPIVQGGTFSFVAPTLSILALDKWKCPNIVDASTFNSSVLNSSFPNHTTPPPIFMGSHEHSEVWQSRMREIQGAIMVASIFQVVIGFSGIMGLMLRFIGPLAIAPTIALVGLSLFGPASNFASQHWWIALLTIVLITAFSQYMRNLKVPCVGYSKGTGCHKIGYPVFTLFPVILSIILVWAICAIITATTDWFPNDPKQWGYGARTDTRIRVLQQAAWFRFPYPGQWGMPTVSTAGVFGMLAGVLASMIESVGDYYACARLSGAPPPPTHAINRGIGIEGIGCILAGAWGSGNGTTSYSENIGAIGITKVGSRRVIQVGACIMILFGVLGKFGALFVTIPDPIIGGVFLVMFGMITAVGISNLQFVDLNSTRNLFVLGFSFFFGLALPQWVNSNTDKINTGVEALDSIITVLLSTSMFVGGFCGFVLDNTIPGTPEERGLIQWQKQLEAEEDGTHTEAEKEALKCYDMPFGMDLLRKVSCFKYVPFCPTFKMDSCSRRRNQDPEDVYTYDVDTNAATTTQF